MNSKAGKRTWVVVGVVTFMDCIYAWMMENVMLPVTIGVRPHGGEEDFDPIIGIAIEICAFSDGRLEGSRVAISFHRKRPGADRCNDVHAQ